MNGGSPVEQFVRKREYFPRKDSVISKEDWIGLLCNFVKNFASFPRLDKQISWKGGTFEELRSTRKSVLGFCIYTGKKPKLDTSNIMYLPLDGINLYDLSKKRWGNSLQNTRAVLCYLDIIANLIEACKSSLKCIILFNQIDRFNYAFRLLSENVSKCVPPGIILYPVHIYLSDFKAKCKTLALNKA
jgi:hypothetical protein